MKKLIVCLILCSIFIGCTSIPRKNSFFSPVDQMVPFEYQTRNVTVSIDYVNDKDIENQVSTLLDTNLSKNKVPNSFENTIFIDFNVVQRSFIQNIDSKNTIYINVTGYDSFEHIVLRQNFYITGDDTFVSSIVQYNCVSSITKELLKYQDTINKSYISN